MTHCLDIRSCHYRYSPFHFVLILFCSSTPQNLSLHCPRPRDWLREEGKESKLSKKLSLRSKMVSILPPDCSVKGDCTCCLPPLVSSLFLIRLLVYAFVSLCFILPAAARLIFWNTTWILLLPCLKPVSEGCQFCLEWSLNILLWPTNFFMSWLFAHLSDVTYHSFSSFDCISPTCPHWLLSSLPGSPQAASWLRVCASALLKARPPCPDTVFLMLLKVPAPVSPEKGLPWSAGFRSSFTQFILYPISPFCTFHSIYHLFVHECITLPSPASEILFTFPAAVPRTMCGSLCSINICTVSTQQLFVQ